MYFFLKYKHFELMYPPNLSFHRIVSYFSEFFLKNIVSGCIAPLPHSIYIQRNFLSYLFSHCEVINHIENLFFLPLYKFFSLFSKNVNHYPNMIHVWSFAFSYILLCTLSHFRLWLIFTRFLRWFMCGVIK